MPKPINSQNSPPKKYDASDMLDAYELAHNDVNWLSLAISHLKEKFYKLKQSTQEQYGVHELYFAEFAELFEMYSHLANDRLSDQKKLVEKFKAEWEMTEEGQR